MLFIVTGGAGFIGSSFIEHVLALNHKVVAIDNFSTGSKENIQSFLSHKNFGFLEHDLSNSFPSKLKFFPNDDSYVCHFAAQVGVESVVHGVSESIKNNIYVTEHVVNFAVTHRIPVLFSSTSEVYGKNYVIPTSERDDRIMGAGDVYRWAYAETKILDELMFKEMWQLHRIPTTSVRLFNTVGPRQSGDYGMVIPRFVRQAILNEPLTIYGTGEQKRTFCSVSDVISAMLQLIREERAYGEVFNIGSTNAISIIELALKIREIVGSNSPIVHMNPFERLGSGFEEIQDRCPKIDKVKSLIGWEPQKSLDDIIKDVASYTANKLCK
jgi:UDP-glucose 4-epimerase